MSHHQLLLARPWIPHQQESPIEQLVCQLLMVLWPHPMPMLLLLLLYLLQLMLLLLLLLLLYLPLRLLLLRLLMLLLRLLVQMLLLMTALHPPRHQHRPTPSQHLPWCFWCFWRFVLLRCGFLTSFSSLSFSAFSPLGCLHSRMPRLTLSSARLARLE
jgi:hypothetical protein